jgi:hypothetical protein
MDLTYPYCGGCGHRFFDSPKLSYEDAEKLSKATKCHYCIEEEIEDAKQKEKTQKPDYDQFDDQAFLNGY